MQLREGLKKICLGNEVVCVSFPTQQGLAHVHEQERAWSIVQKMHYFNYLLHLKRTHMYAYMYINLE